jgi:hypothetical protein
VLSTFTHSPSKHPTARTSICTRFPSIFQLLSMPCTDML